MEMTSQGISNLKQKGSLWGLKMPEEASKAQNGTARALKYNPCLSCPGHCCSQNLINLCGYDVWKISEELHIMPTEFVAFAELNEESPYDFRLDSSDKTYCLALYMKKLLDGNRRCIFGLDLPKHQLRCGIYPFRPIGCRAYPLAFVGEEVVVKPWAMCPEDAWDASQLDLSYWPEELGRHDMEFSIYALAVRSWNKAASMLPELEKLDFRPLLDFLVNVYSRLEINRELISAEAWPGIWKHWRQFTAEGLNPLFLKNEQKGETSWDWWVQDIHKAVAEASQKIPMHTTDPKENSAEEILP